MRIFEATIEVLRETDNPAVMFGDAGLLHAICERAGRPHEGPRTEKKMLDALSRNCGPLLKGLTKLPTGRWVRIFRLPEAA